VFSPLSKAEFIASEIGESTASGLLIESNSSAGEHVVNCREVYWLVMMLISWRKVEFVGKVEPGGVLPTGLWCEASKASLGCREKK
jgi:hypothetical protein